jgi:hypothetical protein
MDGEGCRSSTFRPSLVCINRPKRMSLAYCDDAVVAENIRVKRIVTRSEGRNTNALKGRSRQTDVWKGATSFRGLSIVTVELALKTWGTGSHKASVVTVLLFLRIPGATIFH